MDYKVQNMTVSASLSCTPDLKKIANMYNKQARYNPQKFSGVIVRLQKPKCSMTFHKTGKVVVLGAKSLRQAKRILQKASQMVSECGFNTALIGVTVHNIVVSGALPFKLNASILKKWNPMCISYEPELFPGIHYRVSNSRICVTMFCSGKWYACGAKTTAEIDNIVIPLYLELSVLLN